MKNSSVIKIVYKSKKLRDFLGGVIWFSQMMFLKYFKDPETIDLIRSVKKEIGIFMTPIEAFNIFSISKEQSKLEGDLAEVGVYKGGTAKLICEAKGNRKLHLFDTFEGFPRIDSDDYISKNISWQKNHFRDNDFAIVKNRFTNYENVFLYKGKFPDTAQPIKNCKFSFVHLDVDLYSSTYDSLDFFYPRMINGGIIISHDYHADSVKNAFKEYFKDKKQQIIELGTMQAMVIKI